MRIITGTQHLKNFTACSVSVTDSKMGGGSVLGRLNSTPTWLPSTIWGFVARLRMRSQHELEVLEGLILYLLPSHLPVCNSRQEQNNIQLWTEVFISVYASFKAATLN